VLSSSFPVDRLFPGLSEAVKLMRVGDKTRFWIPESLGRPGAQDGMVVFDVELLAIQAVETQEMPPSSAATQ
jgi:FKBP-type peptidyl-prolyl cis-trans isomerase